MNRVLRLAVFCVAALIVAVSGGGCERQDDPKTLNLYIWAEYLPQSVIDKFTARTGIKVNVDTYDSNETLLQKLQSGGAGYDLCWPSDYMIRALIDEKLVRQIDGAQFPGATHINPRFMDRPFDPGNKHSVPYLWGTTGIGYNKQQVTDPVDGWAILFNEKYAGKILMLDDVRECFAAALKLDGKSLNTTDAAALRAAAAMLKKQKPLVKTYDSDNYDNILAAGDVYIAHGYNGQLAKLAAKDPRKFAYVIPREGATQSQDGMVVPVSARHPENAIAFIQFVLEPQIMAEIVNATSYPSCNEAAKKFINPAIVNNPAIYPPDAMLTNCETMQDLGEAMKLMDQLWTEIKAE